jgi:putative sterol carrier protein
MSKHAFLTEDWVTAVKAVREEFEGKVAPPAHKVRMNLVITDVPHGEGTVNAHMDSSGDEMVMELGHLDDPELTVTLPFDVAKGIFIEGNPQAGMQAFMAGKIKVQGDMTKLMAMQSGAVDPTAAEIAARIAEITE